MKACIGQPCLNGGECSVSSLNPVDYICICKNGYSGRNCQSEWY